MISLKSADSDTTRRKAHAIDASGQTSLQRVLWSALFTPGLEGRRGLPYVLVSEPGAVKTSTVRSLSRMAQLPFESVLGSLRQPMEFMGMPVPQRMQLDAQSQHLSPDGEDSMLYTHYAPAGFGVRAALAKNSVLLFDEANNMPPVVQSAMLRVLFEGVVGELELPPGVRMFLATNSVEDAAGGWDISPAMANRMGWLEWPTPSASQFSAYLSRSGGRGSSKMPLETVDWRVEEREVDAAWDDAWTRAAMLVTGFLMRKEELLHQRPKGNAGKAWPSARTWDFATHALAGSFIYDLSGKERDIACSAYIGSGAYSEFYAWARDADLPLPEDVLTGAVSWRHNPGRMDRTAAVLSGVTSYTMQRQTDKETVRAMWRFLGELPEEAVDLSMPHVMTLTSANLMIGDPAAYKVLSRHDGVLEVSR